MQKKEFGQFAKKGKRLASSCKECCAFYRREIYQQKAEAAGRIVKKFKINVLEKQCIKCQKIKPISDFWKTKYKTYRSQCIYCDREYAKETRRKNQALLVSLKNVPCTDCGENYPSYIMDFDHLDGNTKYQNVSALINSKGKLLEEIKKCEIVCSNCHRERTFNRFMEKVK